MKDKFRRKQFPPLQKEYKLLDSPEQSHIGVLVDWVDKDMSHELGPGLVYPEKERVAGAQTHHHIPVLQTHPGQGGGVVTHESRHFAVRREPVSVYVIFRHTSLCGCGMGVGSKQTQLVKGGLLNSPGSYWWELVCRACFSDQEHRPKTRRTQNEMRGQRSSGRLHRELLATSPLWRCPSDSFQTLHQQSVYHQYTISIPSVYSPSL